MSTRNFKVFAEVVLTDYLEQIRAGEIRMDVSNQRDEAVVESALEVLATDDEKTFEVAQNLEFAAIESLTPITIAYQLAKFKPEPISDGWIV